MAFVVVARVSRVLYIECYVRSYKENMTVSEFKTWFGRSFGRRKLTSDGSEQENRDDLKARRTSRRGLAEMLGGHVTTARTVTA